jgi:hypothetical protein
MGLKLAIDDFGTGYSSLSYLRQFPVDKLKIDKSFIRNVVAGNGDAAITTAIISMAKSLHLKVIAEGVETEEQLCFLREHQCDEMQGYYFSKPVSADEAGGLLLCAQGYAEGLGDSGTAGFPNALLQLLRFEDRATASRQERLFGEQDLMLGAEDYEIPA